MNKFEKVSFEIYAADMFSEFNNKLSLITTDDAINLLRNQYDNIKLPKRATIGSAGYDFYSPIKFDLNPGETIKIPTGIRCQVNNGLFLMIVPRSSIGFKYNVMLSNTCGIIDSDYYYADNEGHIMIKLINHGNKVLSIDVGERFAQGIFMYFNVTEDDCVDATRIGGMGSTNEM